MKSPSLGGVNDACDVALSNGTEYVKAHKLILGICSPWLKSALPIFPNSAIIITLPGVKPQTLQALKDFIYEGRMCLPVEDIQEFINTATILQMKGVREVVIGALRLRPNIESRASGSVQRSELTEIECGHSTINIWDSL
jgi:hypothetical protein